MKISKSNDIEKKTIEMDGVAGVGMRLLIGKDDGAENIAMRMFEVEPGGHTPFHIHPHEHEVFAVAGNGVFVCEGTEYEFGPEHVIFVPGGKQHQFKNTGNSVLRFLCIIPASAS